MITSLQQGHYELDETRSQTKILKLDNQPYAWVHAQEIGELLVSSHREHKTDHVLAQGQYQLYEVKDEPALTDLKHLELSTGDGGWQGYLLLTGLPDDEKTRVRIIPTTEVITTS